MVRNAVLALVLALSVAPLARTADVADADHIYKKAAASTALVAWPQGRGLWSTGTCWVVDAKRKWAVTNYHVAPKNVTTVYVTFPVYEEGAIVTAKSKYDFSKGTKARVVDSDPLLDLAILELESLPVGVEALPLSEQPAAPGQTLHLVGQSGASVGYWTYTWGKVRNRVLRKIVYPDQTTETMVLENQMDTNGGDSGSAVLNNKGEVVAVHSGGAYGLKVHNLAWAIDVTVLKRFLKQVEDVTDRGELGALVYRGERYERKGQWALAIADYSTALKAAPAFGFLYRKRAHAFRKAGLPAIAIADCTRALELNDKDWEAANLRGLAHEDRKEDDQAVADFALAIKLRPGEVAPYFNRAGALRRLGKTEDAITDYTRAVKMAPKFWQAYEKRAFAYRALKKHREAAADFAKVAVLLPGDVVSLVEMGRSLSDAGDFAAAEKAFSLAVEKAPRNADAWFGRGAAREALGNVGLAQFDYARAITINPLLGAKLKTYATKLAYAHNTTKEPVRVRVEFEAQATDGTWRQLTKTWTLAGGEKTGLGLSGGKWIHARKARVWVSRPAVKFAGKGMEVVLVEKPYLALEEAGFVYTVLP
jgi:tetratricopeptide (TPR) repeat protein